MQERLRDHFDEIGRLKDRRGEYFLIGYKGPHQHESEHIFRFTKGKFVEITREVQEIRNVDEATREMRRGERRL